MTGDEAKAFWLSRMNKGVGFHGRKMNKLFKQTWEKGKAGSLIRSIPWCARAGL